MRLTPGQQSAIRSAVAETFGDAANVWLFGSRVDDNKRGGDIDFHSAGYKPPPLGGMLQRLSL